MILCQKPGIVQVMDIHQADPDAALVEVPYNIGKAVFGAAWLISARIPHPNAFLIRGHLRCIRPEIITMLSHQMQVNHKQGCDIADILIDEVAKSIEITVEQKDFAKDPVGRTDAISLAMETFGETLHRYFHALDNTRSR